MTITLQCDRRYVNCGDLSGFPVKVSFTEWAQAARQALDIGSDPRSLRVFETAVKARQGASDVVVARKIAPTKLAARLARQ